MSRSRKLSTHQIVSISMPTKMVEELNYHLSYKASRSEWIRDAIKKKLENLEVNPFDELTLRQCIAMAQAKSKDPVVLSLLDSLIQLTTS